LELLGNFEKQWAFSVLAKSEGDDYNSRSKISENGFSDLWHVKVDGARVEGCGTNVHCLRALNTHSTSKGRRESIGGLKEAAV
jgi:hypothetical protein